MNFENVTNQMNLKKEASKPSIFDFTDYSDFLNSYVQSYGKYSHGPYNLKNWAQRLGYKSPSSLAMVLNKQRLPTLRMVGSFISLNLRRSILSCSLKLSERKRGDQMFRD